MRKGFLWNENFGNFCYFLMNKINIFIAFEPSTKAWKWIKMLNPKCLCKLAKTKVDLLICTNLCRVLKNKTQHKHNRARAAVQRTIFLLKFALFSKPFLKKVCASDDCNSGLDADWGRPLRSREHINMCARADRRRPFASDKLLQKKRMTCRACTY